MTLAEIEFIKARFQKVTFTLQTLDTKPRPYDLYFAVKNPGDNTGWNYHCAGLGVADLEEATKALGILHEIVKLLEKTPSDLLPAKRVGLY